jgi:hypothetical protein
VKPAVPGALSVTDLLDEADRLLREPVPHTGGLWPRTVALLVRLALEQSLDDWWRRREPGLEGCSMRAQLLCLPCYVDPVVASDTAAVWSALSRATHHHAYELAPSAGELRGWLESVRGFARSADAACGASPVTAPSAPPSPER